MEKPKICREKTPPNPTEEMWLIFTSDVSPHWMLCSALLKGLLMQQSLKIKVSCIYARPLFVVEAKKLPELEPENAARPFRASKR